MRPNPILFLPAALLVTSLSAHAQIVRTNGAVGTNITVTTLSTGNVLNVTPAVSADQRYVGMAINPQFSTLDGIDTFVLTNPLGAAISPRGGGMGPAVAVSFSTGGQATGISRPPFRAAQVGHVIFVDHDKPLLATRVSAIDWKATSLKDGTRRLADVTKLNMVLGLRGLQQAGIDINAPHDLALPPGTVKDALFKMLEAAAPQTDMVITAEDKVIQVSTQAQSDLVMVSKTYYLQDLLNNVGRFIPAGTDVEAIGPQPQVAPAGTDEQWNDVGDFSQSLDAAKSAEDRRAAAKSHAAAHAQAQAKKKPPVRSSTNIAEIISDTVRPEIWRNHGGKGEIYQIGDKVTIKAPASVHAILEGPSSYNPNQNPAYIMYQR